jgi:hypothetical protein
MLPSMAQRVSGYVRQANDSYQTPSWVTDALSPHLQRLALHIWEPACGDGAMADALTALGYRVHASDIITGDDFLKAKSLPSDAIQGIVTNPPYSIGQAFIEHALQLTKPVGGVVAMLLRCDYDHAKTRRHLFADCPAFAKKIILTKRIVWFQRPGAAPSFNHCWCVWDHHHSGKPTIEYAPVPQGCE